MTAWKDRDANSQDYKDRQSRQTGGGKESQSEKKD